MVNVRDTFDTLQSGKERAPWPSVEMRRSWLRALKASIVDHRAEIRKAVWDDFGKSAVEADLTEIMPVLLEIRTALRNLKSWAAATHVRSSFPLVGLRGKVVYRPKGVVLIISPWNYPVNLSLGPLVSALAAGNRAVLKPSERVPNSSNVVAKIVADALPAEVATVVLGGPDVGSSLLELPFNHFYFTGGSRVGQIVMHAAANHLSTATLELGGKSPAIVDGTVDVVQCAEKVVRGKFLNGGQTCIAPDYVVVQELHFDRFLNAAVSQAAMFSEAAEMSAPVDENHSSRLETLLNDAVEQGAVVHSALTPESGLTIVTGVPLTSSLMREEIFGPILPVLRFGTEEELVGILAVNPTPLTTYIFSNDDQAVERLLQRVESGSVCVNETLLHFVHPNLPFGGVGTSGSGRSHGRAGFEAFSNLLPTMRQMFGRGLLPMIYPATGKVQDSVRSILFRLLAR